MSRRRIIQPDARTYRQKLEAASEALAPAIVASLANIRREVLAAASATEQQGGEQIFFNAQAYRTYTKRESSSKKM